MKRTRVIPTMNPIATCAECRMETYCREETSTGFPTLKCHHCIVAKIKKLHASTLMKIHERHERMFTGRGNAIRTDLDTLQEKLQKQEDKTRFLGLSLNCGNVRESDLYKGDIKIVVQGQCTLYAHAYILCQRSPVFKRMLESDFSEKTENVIRINDATLSVMMAVINFFYDAHIAFYCEVTPEEVLKVAQKYDVYYLQSVCEERMMTTMDADNLATRLKLAKKLDKKKLQIAAEEFLKNNFDRLISTVVDDLQ